MTLLASISWLALFVMATVAVISTGIIAYFCREQRQIPGLDFYTFAAVALLLCYCVYATFPFKGVL